METQNEVDLHMHCGSMPVHSPFSWHFLTITSPCLTTNPLLQMYVARDPTLRPVTKRVALLGSGSKGHITAV